MDGNLYALNHYMDEYDRMMDDERRIRNEMEKRKDQVTKKIASAFPLEFHKEIIPILLHGWKEELPEAITLAKRLDLSKEDFYVLDEDLTYVEEDMRDLAMEERYYESAFG